MYIDTCEKITVTKINNYIDINTGLGNILHKFIIILRVFPKSILYNKIINNDYNIFKPHNYECV